MTTYSIRKREGFEGQILHVVPRPILDNASKHPLVSSLMPTDIGWYPQARYHYCQRETGAPEHILILCMDGTGWYQFDDKIEAVYPHEALFIPRDTPHIYGASDTDPWSIHWVHFAGRLADYYMHLLPQGQPKIMVDAQTVERLVELFRACSESFEASFVLQRMIFAAQTLHHLLAYLFFSNRSFSPTLQTSSFHNLDTTIALLHQNVKKNLTLDEMAAHAGLSTSHFSRLFREQTGYSPIDYFIHLKMQHACMLLILSRKTIREIGFEIGYDDPYYFSRIFKKVVGMSPKQYRNTH